MTQLYSEVNQGCAFLCCQEPYGMEIVLVWCKSFGGIAPRGSAEIRVDVWEEQHYQGSYLG